MRAVKVILGGVVVFFAVYLIQTWLGSALGQAESFAIWWLLVLASIEEVGKLSPVFFLNKEVGRYDLMKYAVLSAWTLAVIETFFFEWGALSDGQGFNWVRPILAVNVHVVATLIASSYWTRNRRFADLLKGLLIAVLVHTLFNIIVINWVEIIHSFIPNFVHKIS
jgi:hypothetical protein